MTTTPTLREAAQQALEALETHVPQYLKDRGYAPITALRSALAEQAAEQAEPVAVPAEYDVRTILLDVVPGDGAGHEVYAKSVNEVRAVRRIPIKEQA